MVDTPILIVEDDPLVAMVLGDILSDAGYAITRAASAAEAELALAEGTFDLALLDMVLPDIDGRELLKKWRQERPDMVVVIMTGHGDVATAVECIRAGACDFLAKPIERVFLLRSLEQAIRQRSLARQVNVLTELHRREVSTPEASEFVTDSPLMDGAMSMVRRIAASDFSCLLIQGESGTGKGLLARTIHRLGTRSDKPFVDVDCSAIPPTLIESELFGHAKGAFTDAKEDKIGLFEMADGGTLFLDEIGDMELSLQAKLLKVIEEQRFRRVGSVKEVVVDVAIVAATNQDLDDLVRSGKFREDLFYRLNVIPLVMPPLRQRRKDIPALADHFVHVFARKLGKPVTGLSKDAMEALDAYAWPGNVRELRNVVERGCILAETETIDRDALLFISGTPGSPSHLTGSGRLKLPPMTMAQAEKLAVEAAMEATQGNKNQAARILQVHRTTLYAKLAEHAKLAKLAEDAE